MEFKVGQRVKVKQLIGDSYCEVTDLYIPNDMAEYSGKITTIALLARDDTVLLNDCEGYLFSIYMLTPIKSRLKRK